MAFSLVDKLQFRDCLNLKFPRYVSMSHRISSFARMCYSRQIQKTILTFLDRGFSNKKSWIEMQIFIGTYDLEAGFLGLS